MLAASGTPGMDGGGGGAAVPFVGVVVALDEEGVEAGGGFGGFTRSPFASVSVLARLEGTSLPPRFLPLSDGLLLVLPLGRPGPRLSGSCCVPFDAVVVVVVDEEVAELLLSFFRRIRASGPSL